MCGGRAGRRCEPAVKAERGPGHSDVSPDGWATRCFVVCLFSLHAGVMFTPSTDEKQAYFSHDAILLNLFC